MSKKKTVLIKVSYLVDLTENELTGRESILDEITLKVGKKEQISVNGKNIDLKWIETSSHTLDIENENCGKCTNCRGWVTDREKPNSILELCNGATVNGKLLCDECLPPDHRWAF